MYVITHVGLDWNITIFILRYIGYVKSGEGIDHFRSFPCGTQQTNMASWEMSMLYWALLMLKFPNTSDYSTATLEFQAENQAWYTLFLEACLKHDLRSMEGW